MKLCNNYFCVFHFVFSALILVNLIIIIQIQLYANETQNRTLKST